MSGRRLAGHDLSDALRGSRARTLSLALDLSDAQWRPPPQAGVNPLAWELAHLAWFADFWIRRGPHRLGADGFVHAAQAARHAAPDALFDSSRQPHDERWRIALPPRAELLHMLDAQLADCLAALPAGEDDAALYGHRLALFHEDMHGEAFAWMRAALGYPPPAGMVMPRMTHGTTLSVHGADVFIGWPLHTQGFAFDNEQPGHRLRLPDFEIDAAPVTVGAFLRFVDAGGYDNPAWWPGTAGAWRAKARRRCPERWRRAGRGWEHRWFDRWLPLSPTEPVVHVNAFEAEAYCLWARRRLPQAAQWEHAAASAGPSFRWGGSVWEWTADAFQPYPGFTPGPYRDYSVPWFGNHRELRGGAFATHPRMHDLRYRNFFMPQRSDVFAGFRTAALSQ